MAVPKVVRGPTLVLNVGYTRMGLVGPGWVETARRVEHVQAALGPRLCFSLPVPIDKRTGRRIFAI